jgi:hypothetical protein
MSRIYHDSCRSGDKMPKLLMAFEARHANDSQVNVRHHLPGTLLAGTPPSLLALLHR